LSNRSSQMLRKWRSPRDPPSFWTLPGISGSYQIISMTCQRHFLQGDDENLIQLGQAQRQSRQSAGSRLDRAAPEYFKTDGIPFRRQYASHFPTSIALMSEYPNGRVSCGALNTTARKKMNPAPPNPELLRLGVRPEIRLPTMKVTVTHRSAIAASANLLTKRVV